MFVDLVGSSRLAATLDPEDFGTVIAGYRRVAAADIEARDGIVVRYIGDGVVACWGYPRSRERDARRSIEAALAIVAAIQALDPAELPLGVTLNVRIALDSGVVMVGQIGPSLAGAAEIVGEAPVIAARVQQLAEPNTVLVTETVRQMAERHFEFEPRGSHDLRGISGAVAIYCAIRKRTDSDVIGGLGSGILGRERDEMWLDAQWRSAEGGHGQTAVIVGEPGIGKTTLVEELRRKLAKKVELSLVCHCLEEGRHIPLAPVRELVRQALGLAIFSDAVAIRARIGAVATRDGLDGDSALQILIPLLDSRLTNELSDLAPPPLNAVSFIVDWFRTIASRAPMLIVVEDAHWADESSIYFFEVLSLRISAARLLLVLTSRTSLNGKRSAQTGAKVLRLDRLSDATIERLVARMTGSDIPELGMSRAIVVRAEGNPLFAGELVRLAAKAQATGRSAGLLVLPSTLNASLSARLDDLGELRWVALSAAVLGRDFNELVLAQVLDMTAVDVRPKLQALADAGILNLSRDGAGATHAFRHSLIREVAYNSLLKEQRAALHGKTASVIVGAFPWIAEQHPELVAQHFEGSALYAEAIRWWTLAAEQAGRRSMTADAIRLLERADALCARLPSGAASLSRAQVLNSLGVQYIAAHGYASANVERAFGQAVALLDRPDGGAKPLLFALWGLHVHSMVRGDVPRALALGAKILRLSETEGDADMFLQGHRLQGLASLLSGSHSDASRHCRALLGQYDAVAHERHRYRFGGDPKTLVLAQLAWSEWISGRIRSSHRHASEAVAFARDLAHPHTLVYALGVNALRLLTANDVELAEEAASETREIAAKHEFSYWAAWSDIILAAVRGTTDPMRGSDLLRVAIDKYQVTGARQLVPFAMAQEAECLIKLQRIENALRIIEEGLSLIEATGVRLYQAELLRLRALARHLQHETCGLDDLEAAADLAEKQEANSFVVRSLITMADCNGREALTPRQRARLAGTIRCIESDPEIAELRRARALIQA
jgi:class 3 adenylate cyclase/DNA-binding transcriptional MerR regulator